MKKQKCYVKIKDWENQKERLENSDNSSYWLDKITRNMERDKEVEKQLRLLGWTVLRFWGNDIIKNTALIMI